MERSSGGNKKKQENRRRPGLKRTDQTREDIKLGDEEGTSAAERKQRGDKYGVRGGTTGEKRCGR